MHPSYSVTEHVLNRSHEVGYPREGVKLFSLALRCEKPITLISTFYPQHVEIKNIIFCYKHFYNH